MTPATPRDPARRNAGWLSAPEQAAIRWLAPHLPAALTPDRLTAIGFAAAVVAATAYILASRTPAWLWVVNAALVANWFGDSLDGAVARLRGIERPRYGFFLDQSVDVISQALFAIGLGLSGYVSLPVASLGLAAFLMMTVQSLLRAQVTGTFHLASGGIGLTEVRVLFVAANTLFFLVPPSPFELWSLSLVYGDLLGIIWIAVSVSFYLVTMRRQIAELSERPDS